METFDTFGFLLGRWTVHRDITDHLTRTDGTFSGKGTLSEQSGVDNSNRGLQAQYVETGELRLGDHRGPAQRNLRYVRQDDATVLVYFVDRRVFVDLDLRSGEWHSMHICGTDHYHITTIVRSAHLVEERWQVRGLAKYYDAMTTLTRIDEQDC